MLAPTSSLNPLTEEKGSLLERFRYTFARQPLESHIEHIVYRALPKKYLIPPHPDILSGL